MSHFSALVIGENAEAQLAPYHEFECTGISDQYVIDVDITAEIKKLMEGDEPMSLKDALEYHGLEDRAIQYEHSDPAVAEAQVDRKGKHKYGYAFVWEGLNESKLIKAVKRTNPNKKWDWYVLGGRYTGRLKLKAGRDMRHGVIGRPGLMTDPADAGYVDQANKGDIDFEAMRNEKEQEARERYRGYFAMLTQAGAEFPKSWEVILAKHGGQGCTQEQLGAAREEYREQPAIKAGNETKEYHSFFEEPAGEFGCTEEEYAQRARKRAFGSFAVVKDGKWYERGGMGWWGIVHDEKDEDAWLEEFAKLTDSLSDDTLLSMYDCHI